MICIYLLLSIYLYKDSINYNPVYRETVRIPVAVAEYYKNKPDELEEYRNKWTKRPHLFETTYSSEIIAKAGGTKK